MPSSLQSVFVVEDSEMERSMLSEHLEKIPGVKVKTFSNGSACLRDIIMENVQEPDLILMDYFMDSAQGSNRDGLEILEKLVEFSPELKVIMFTSVGNEKMIALAKSKGALDYVVKSSAGFEDLDKTLKKHFGV
ncbi:MAG: response regulator [Bacteroidetes bacterium]|nr:MAG: response regulator [Bacteroidota bacterium]REK07069.1 MAG: response regulator [Bacteroidota bacterium]REK33585.1 MAG: response regulator [Bacteroidota bacterium]REK48569.1 MAG: response regulator [Bacteroidota bacterium]